MVIVLAVRKVLQLEKTSAAKKGRLSAYSLVVSKVIMLDDPMVDKKVYGAVAPKVLM